MRKFITAVFLFFIIVNINAGNMAVGVVLGYPDAITLRMDLNQKSAVDAYLGWDYEDLWFSFDYVMKTHMNFGEFPLQVYFGGGAIIEVGSRLEWDYDPYYGYWHYVNKGYFNLGIRGVVGANYFFGDNNKFAFFIETGPGIAFIHFYPTVWGGVGLRYYF